MTGSPYRTALLGTGRIGSHHARTIHREVHGLDLVLLADPVAGIARTLADELGVERAGTDPVAAATDDGVALRPRVTTPCASPAIASSTAGGGRLNLCPITTPSSHLSCTSEEPDPTTRKHRTDRTCDQHSLSNL